MNPIFGFNKGLDYSYLYGSGTVKSTSMKPGLSFMDFVKRNTSIQTAKLPTFVDKKKIIEGIKPSEFPKAKYKNLSNVKSFSRALENTAMTLESTEFSDRKLGLKALKRFTIAYNNLIESSADTENASILRREVFLTGRTSTFTSLLENIGIQIEKNNTLSVNEDVFMGAKISEIEELFIGRQGFAGRVGKQAKVIAEIAENKMNSLNKTYNRLGKFYRYDYATRIYEAV